jgi:2-alkyl-3-oxoalkanoate reductase
MRVFVAGATGVIGQYLVPGLIGAGHEVVRKRQMPVVDGGTGIWSFIEVTGKAAHDDAA